MKFLVAFALIVVSMVAAESQRPRVIFAKQQKAPYKHSGWRPTGEQFNLPARSLNQQSLPKPNQAYGPPAPEEVTEEPIPTTTELLEESTTLLPQSENLEDLNENEKKDQAKSVQPSQYYVVLPQTPQNYIVAQNPQNYILAQNPQSYILAQNPQLYAPAPVPAPAGKLVNAQQLAKEPRKVPVQAVPAFAKIQEPVYAKIVQPVQVPVVPLRLASSAYTSSVYTPYSSSFVQVVQ